MKVLVVGGGGREHAICTALKKSPKVTELYCAPGNGGIAEIATCKNIGATDVENMVAYAKEEKFDLVFADPPYALEKLPEIPDLIFSRNLLADGGLFVFEHGKQNDFSGHPQFVEHRSYGSVNFSIFRASTTEEGSGEKPETPTSE